MILVFFKLGGLTDHCWIEFYCYSNNNNQTHITGTAEVITEKVLRVELLIGDSILHHSGFNFRFFFKIKKIALGGWSKTKILRPTALYVQS